MLSFNVERFDVMRAFSRKTYDCLPCKGHRNHPRPFDKECSPGGVLFLVGRLITEATLFVVIGSAPVSTPCRGLALLNESGDCACLRTGEKEIHALSPTDQHGPASLRKSEITTPGTTTRRMPVS